jgi:hypothetical protein
LFRKPGKRYYFEDAGLNGRILLREIFKKYEERKWTGFGPGWSPVVGVVNIMIQI